MPEAILTVGFETDVEHCNLVGHDGDVRVCDISPDGGLIVSTGRDGRLKIWDAERGLCLSTYLAAATRSMYPVHKPVKVP
jgi:WD40 repeat protein